MKMVFGLVLVLSAALVNVNAGSACTNLLENIDNLQESLNQMNETLTKQNQLINKLEASRCAFNAKTHYQDEKTLDDSPIVFNYVSLNTCGGYDKNTGIFTAPVAGTYWLHVRVQSAGKGKGDVFLKRNDGELCLAYVTPGTWGDMSSCSVAVDLVPGDQVKVTGNQREVPASIFGGTRNGFSGFLLYPA